MNQLPEIRKCFTERTIIVESTSSQPIDDGKRRQVAKSVIDALANTEPAVVSVDDSILAFELIPDYAVYCGQLELIVYESQIVFESDGQCLIWEKSEEGDILAASRPSITTPEDHDVVDHGPQ